MPSTELPDISVGPDKTLRIGMTRRRFLTWTGVAAGLAVVPGLLGDATAAPGPPRAGDRLFTLGVASGDPVADGVVLWTRLARSPLERGGGMGMAPIGVDWEIATDEAMRRVARRGRVVATAESGHSVHVDVRGLDAAREYFFRFRAAGDISEVGRTRTAPAGRSSVNALTFAFASCQSWADGHYGAYADMASHAPDVVFHLGDYIYEKPIPGNGGRRATSAMPASALRECMTLDDYRDRYALYKLDPHLRLIHRTSPFITVFDDHEVDNNWAASIPEDGMPVPAFLLRRAQGLRAWWENTPVRAAQHPRGADIRAYRRFGFGNLVEFNVLDTRTFRSDQANGDNDTAQNAVTADPRRTIVGAAQERWLLDGLARSGHRWNVMAHQTTIADLARVDNGVREVSMDGWSGYEASRARILDGAQERGVRNLVSIVGDIHRNVVSELRSTYTRESPTVGVELAGTSISSGGDGQDSDTSDRALKTASPHIRFGNAQRGYVLNRLRRDRWEAEFRVADSIATPSARLHRRALVTIPDSSPAVDVV
ncbi:alkaline phosphatase D family protein [Gordonia sp. ABSL11-1]|uniref:alkaline phosphatase D family protein n=1 Tax=Gordonia sp. ABSL11-1 TaxID=3053924 RepID=UPI002572D4DB|nr:alkaline phosphatase D family protein [Gordonia sp. ABSL11-1]MDL9948228.1 alkaline phosphatase D family protein [Gordonia sp. ABSL11-1]